jgi:hypothetical protein
LWIGMPDAVLWEYRLHKHTRHQPNTGTNTEVMAPT